MSDKLFPLHQYKNVIIDVDGTLVDSNDAQAHAYLDALAENGIHHISFNTLRRLIGMSSEDILSHVLGEDMEQQTKSRIEACRVRIFEERYIHSVKPTPGVLPLLELFEAYGLRIVLSSGSPKQFVEHFIAQLGIRPLIEGYVSKEDTPTGKPNPIAIEVVCEKFRFQPMETMLIGDSPFDIIAAHEALVPTIAVLTGGYTATELRKTGAIDVYKDLNEIYQLFQQTVLYL
jgi:HAD superfamily hydrolase (TIGR01509 family)